MGINVTMSGSGDIGDITPGWSVSEYATPVVIGESGGGTGSVSFNARATDESLFIVNNDITTTEENLGYITGVVNSVSQNGINVNVAHNTRLSLLDADLDIPALGAGGVVPALDIVDQLTKRDIILNSDRGYFYSLRGHSQGFDKDGAPAKVREFDGVEYGQIIFDADQTNDEIFYYKGQIGAVYASDFFVRDNQIWAGTVDGDWFPNEDGLTSSRIFFKTLLGDETINLTMGSLLYLDNDFEGTYYFTVTLDKAAQELYVTGEYIAGGTTSPIYDTVSLSALDLDSELGFFFEFKRPNAFSGAHVINAIVCNTSDYTNYENISVSYTSARAGGTKWRIYKYSATAPAVKSGLRSLYRADDSGLPASGFATVAVNYIKNPSFEVNANSWTPGAGTTLAVETGGYVGAKRLVASSATGSVSFSQRIDATYDDVNNFDAARIIFTGDTGQFTSASISIKQYGSSDNLLSDTLTSPYWNADSGSTSAAAWTQIYVPFTLVPGVAYFTFSITGFTSAPSKKVYFDAAMVTRSGNPFAYGQYFDGDTTDTTEYNYTYDVDGTSLQQVSLGALNREYENPITFNYSEINLGGPVPAASSNGWQYIQDACAAYGEELALVSDNIVVRPLGQNSINIDNIVGAPTVTPRIILGGRKVEIVHYDSRNVDNGEIYNARNDDNRIVTVKANETVTTTVSTSSNAFIVNKPTRVSTIPAGGTMAPGTYAVSSSTVVIPNNLWEIYGGSINIEVSEDDPSALDITLVGPTTLNNIFGESGALYPGPYKLAFTADGTDYASLSVTGSGVLYEENVLQLQTGADPDKVSQEIARTVTNPFIDSLERAYDRGVWAANIASGPTVTLSGTIAVSELQSFGFAAGSLISYRDSIYRVTDVNIGNLAVSFNATRHVTVEDFDTLWAGKTVGTHDLMWLSYDTSDQNIAPLRYVGDNESVLMFLDTDVNPYYDFTGEPEISVFPDTDFNPYYQDGGNLEGEDPIYLDDDTNPYDGGDGYGS